MNRLLGISALCAILAACSSDPPRTPADYYEAAEEVAQPICELNLVRRAQVLGYADDQAAEFAEQACDTRAELKPWIEFALAMIGGATADAPEVEIAPPPRVEAGPPEAPEESETPEP